MKTAHCSLYGGNYSVEKAKFMWSLDALSDIAWATRQPKVSLDVTV